MKRSIDRKWIGSTAGFAAMLALTAVPVARGQNILTERYDNARTGANLSETQLSPATVNTGNFGKVWTYSVIGSVFAQPLYVHGLSIGGGTHNVVYVATMDDVVYAFDADSTTVLWTVGVGTPVPITDIVAAGQNISGDVGIEGTPVIDLSTNTMYLLARTKDSIGCVTGIYCQRLHALDIRTGAEKFGGPIVISATSGGLTFDPVNENQRASLALANGQIYIAWASHQDKTAWYGWIMSYSASTLAQTGVFVPSQNGNGVWMSGRAPAVDASGNVYYMTGNGSWNGTSNFSESMLKFGAGSGLSLVDWFTPSSYASLDSGDLDYGASGPLLVPGTSLVVGGGKEGIFYVMNSGNLGHEQAGNGQIVQSLANNGGYIKSGPVYWNRVGGAGPWMYDWSDGGAGGDVLKAYHFNGSTFDTTPAAQSTIVSPAGNSGGVLTLSANGGTPGTGIVWACMPVNSDGDNGVHAGILRAFNADNLAQELWDSSNGTDTLGNWPKFSAPLVANGRVYVGSYPSGGVGATTVSVYGLGPATPQFTSEETACNGAYQVHWNSVANATSYQIWDKPPGGTTYSLLLSTAQTTALVHTVHSNSPTSFEVQACNGSLCGRLSGAIALNYYTGCP